MSATLRLRKVPMTMRTVVEVKMPGSGVDSWREERFTAEFRIPTIEEIEQVRAKQRDAAKDGKNRDVIVLNEFLVGVAGVGEEGADGEVDQQTALAFIKSNPITVAGAASKFWAELNRDQIAKNLKTLGVDLPAIAQR